MSDDVCKECEVETGDFARGLCFKCWKNPVIRAKHPPKKGGGGRNASHGREETMEDLDALEARQRKIAPPWFFKDSQNGGCRR